MARRRRRSTTPRITTADRRAARDKALKRERLLMAGLGLLVAAGVGGVVVWLSQREVDTVSDASTVLLVDLSGTSDPASRCADVVALAAQAIDTAPDGGLTLALAGTGGASNGNQVVPAGRWTLEAEVSAFAAAGIRQEDRDHTLDEVRATCEAMETVETSPLRGSLEGALNLVRSGVDACGAEPGNCRVIFRTDGLDTLDSRLRWDLGIGRKKRGSSAPDMPPLLDNGGVDTVFCGLSQRVLEGPARHLPSPSLAELQAAWRPHFAESERVGFDAVCVGGAVARR